MFGDRTRVKRILAMLPSGVYIDDDHPDAARARQAFIDANRDRHPVRKRVFGGAPGYYYDVERGPGLLHAPRTAYRPKGDAAPGGRIAGGPPGFIDPWGLAALILAVLAAPIGVLLGLVSLLRSSGGRYVLWPAVVAIVVGSALCLGGIAVFLVLLDTLRAASR